MPAFVVQILVAVVISVVASLLAPKPKSPTPDSAKELDSPTADAGRPLPVVFGTVTIKSPNTLWFGGKDVFQYKVSA